MRAHRTKNKNKILAAIESYKNGLSVTQIKIKYGLTIKFFKKLLEEHNLEYINKAKNPNDESFKIIQNNFDKIVAEYNETKNMAAIAKRYNVCSTAIRDWLIRHNISRRTHKVAPSNEILEQIKFEMFNLYKQGMDKSALAKKYNLTRYHVTKILKTEFDEKHLRSRSQATTLKNQNADFQQKVLDNHYKSKDYILPSGKTIKVMGYEDDFLNYVLQTKKMSEENFQFDQKPHILYKDNIGNYRKYFPDFYMSKINLIIEIKSNYTLNKQKEINERKFQAARQKYNFICIVDKNYEEFNKLVLSLVDK
jgi:Mor family transcriptional regulator